MDILELTKHYKQKGVLIDSSLLLLLFIGTIKKSFITQCTRTSKYEIADYDLLDAYIGNFNRRFTTPNLLTEVWNLANTSVKGHYRELFFAIYRKGISILDEHYITSRDATSDSSYIRFGLPDAVSVRCATGRYLLLTDDFPLYHYCSSNDVDAVNFNHLRVAKWRL